MNFENVTQDVVASELTYYPVYEPGTRLLEPGYSDSVVSK